MSLERALQFLSKQEGGWANDAHDRGGETFRGIARKHHPDWKGWPLIDSGLRQTSELDQMVAEFYEFQYWQPAHCYELPEPVDLVVFDYAVHSGVKRAVKTLQATIGTTPDGSFGPASRAALVEALATYGPGGVALKVIHERRSFMVRGFRRGSFSPQEPLRFLSGFWKRLTDLAFEVGRG